MAVIRGTALADLLYGLFAADRISALGGDDTVFGQPGGDRIDGGAGNDVIESSFGNDIVDGGAGDDNLTDNGGGSDRIFGRGGDDAIFVQPLNFEGPSDVLIDGGDGNDRINYSGFLYKLNHVTINGGAGADIINVADAASAIVNPGTGNSWVSFNTGSLSHELKLISGYRDTLSLNPAFFGPDEGTATISGFEPGSGGDFLDFFNLTNSFESFAPNANPFSTGHVKILQRGSDAIFRIDVDGGGDNFRDLIVFKDLRAGQLTGHNLGWNPKGGAFAGQAVTGTAEIDFLFGSSGNDNVKGLLGDDMLWGGRGNDRLSGGDGDDEMQGQAGNDTLRGGRGEDVINEFLGGNDQMFGEEGDDTLIVTPPAGPPALNVSPPAGTVRFNVMLDGGAGDDNVLVNGFSSPINVTIHTGLGDDTVTVNNKPGGTTTISDTGGNNLFTLNTLGDKTTINLGGGTDVIQLGSAQLDGLTIHNFKPGDKGDILEFTEALQAEFASVPEGANIFDPGLGFLKLTRSGSNTIFQIDANGNTGGHTYNPFLMLTGVTPDEISANNLSGFDRSGSVSGRIINGDELANNLYGGPGSDRISGNGGNDYTRGADGDDRLFGNAGHDSIYGGLGDDVILGGTGNDDIFDNYGADRAEGESGNDHIQFFRIGRERVRVELDGGTGKDLIEFNGNDKNVRDDVRASGGSGADSILVLGGAEQTIINAGAGIDWVKINAGETRHNITLGTGSDYLSIGAPIVTPPSIAEIRIKDLTPGSSGDYVIFEEFLMRELVNWSPLIDPFESGQLRLVQKAAGAELQYARSAGGDWIPFILFGNVQARDLTAENLGGFTPPVQPDLLV